jgi:hypothetical protein
MEKLQPSHPFSGVGLMLVMLCGCMESVLFDVTEVTLPFNAILGRPALYQFMVVTHYGYLVLKMPSTNDILKIRGDYDAGACALEKLQALVVACEAAAEPRG